MGQQSQRRSFVTAAEVAKRAGVSRSAVSRAFTPGASVSLETRERIVRAADHLGYRVNRLAQSLTNAHSNVIGLVGTDLQQPFHAAFLTTLSAALLADGYQCMLLNAANAEQDMSALIARVLEYRVFAIVVMTGTPPARVVEECLTNGVPVILVNKLLPGIAVDTVVADHASGGRIAAERLLAAGCRRLAVVSGAARTASLVGRLEAFRAAAVAGAGAPVRVWENGPTDYRSGWDAARALLAEEDYDGVFCVTDLLALGFLDAARSLFDRQVPADLSVIGFDDIPQAGWSAYRLTTFRQPVAKLTAAVMDMLRHRAQHAAPSHVLRTVPIQLVVRSTLRGLPARGAA
jgi:DNA-binding LacI/PurR family transcriptional regulator